MGSGGAGTRTGTSCCKSGSSSVCSRLPQRSQSHQQPGDDDGDGDDDDDDDDDDDLSPSKISTSRPLLVNPPCLVTVTVVLVPSSSWTTSFISVLS